MSRGQLEALGVRAGGLARRVAAGRLHRVHVGVYAVGHPLITAEGRWMAAVLACGRGALLSHKPAGAVWAIRPMDSGRIDVTVPSRTGRRGPPGVTVHRPRSFSSLDADRRAGIPITSPARTLFDLAEVIPPPALERAVERAEALRLFDLRQMRRLLAASRGRRGSRALAEILHNAAAEPAISRSELEDLFLELCSRHGVPRPLAGARVGPYEVDFLWPGERVVVETDGRLHHGTRAAFERDRARDAWL